jgi:cytochrome c biogenesis protein CcmG/thiol:disulfide interchange protein DsbE
MTTSQLFRTAVWLPLLAVVLSFATLPAHADGLDLSAYNGKVVYLDFWASWCTPCRLSFPWMNEVQSVYGRDGLVVIGVNVDHDRDLAQQFLEATAPQFKIIYDPNGTVASHFKVKDMPTSVLIGRDGRIHYVHSGFYPGREDSYVADINALLQQKAP